MIEWIDIPGESLRNAILGDPKNRKCALYLPPHFQKTPSKAYPLLTFLCGWGGKSWKYLKDESPFDRPLDHSFDSLIVSGQMPPFIGAFPDGSSSLGGTQYLNSPIYGNMMDYIAKEIPTEISRHYPISADREHRALLGHSSGGFGALCIGLFHSNLFSKIAASASDSFFEYMLMSSIVPTQIEIEKAGSVAAFIEEIMKSSNPGSAGHRKIHALMTLSLAACYAPREAAGAPLYGDLYFDLKTGKIIPEIYEKYLSWDPIRLFARESQRAQKIDYIYLDAGTSDEYGLHLGHRQLASVLTELGISHDLVEFSGGHSGQSHRFAERSKILLNKMKI